MNIKSVPRTVVGPREGHERKTTHSKTSGGSKGALFGSRHQRLGSEDADKIYVSTDVITDREIQDQSDHGSGVSAARQQPVCQEW